jgi:hypothetical protein
MWNAALVLGGHFVCANVEAAIDGRGIATDDLAVVLLGKRQGQGALAGRGRPENRQDAREIGAGQRIRARRAAAR